MPPVFKEKQIMRKTTIRQTNMMPQKTATLSHLVPEKLPCDQPWRFTMSLSFAKVMRNSVMAEQM